MGCLRTESLLWHLPRVSTSSPPVLQRCRDQDETEDQDNACEETEIARHQEDREDGYSKETKVVPAP